ncbi:sigma-70 family RNA polymerase sigma factor [bacterium]|nr:sigma-70 family RNA polymerase sigma factor [bacterium]
MTTSNHQRDRDLAERAAGGDERAWREIYEETCQPLFNTLCFQTGHRETARDLLQETYLKAWRHLGAYRGEGSLLAWLRGIAVRLALDWRRGLGRRLRSLVTIHQDDGTDLDLPDDDREDARDARLSVGGRSFQGALARLSPKQRACLILHELEELPFAEVAREVGCSEPTARVHHLRARQKLNEWLTVPAEEIGGQQA